MKHLLIPLMFVLAFAACRRKPVAPVLHVVSAESSCDGGRIVGTASSDASQYRTYTLTPDRTQLNETLGPYGQYAVPCYGPIGPDDVGRDFVVTIQDGVVRISVPDGKLFRYNIESAKEGSAAP